LLKHPPVLPALPLPLLLVRLPVLLRALLLLLLLLLLPEDLCLVPLCLR